MSLEESVRESVSRASSPLAESPCMFMLPAVEADGALVVSDLVPAIVASQPASFNPTAPLVELETQLRTAIACADASNKTAAALILYMVEQRKQTVRSIAKTVGKSVGWVHGMLVWARADYVGEPFGGPARKAARERADAHEPQCSARLNNPCSPRSRSMANP
jgi:hypothetical protein